tara:strand:- start:7429 stop:7749 length:321 start_codon:yes stop_codon:yes gene_type:complete
MSAEITLKHARDMLRHLVWWLDCAAAAVGWSFLLLLALSGFSLLISGALIGGFFTHYVDAAAPARASFHLFAVPLALGVFALTVWMRWTSRIAITGPREAQHVAAE